MGEKLLYTQNYIYLQRSDDICVGQANMGTNKVAILITNANCVFTDLPNQTRPI